MRIVDPTFGLQRGWTIYEKPQPAFSFGGNQICTIGTTKKPINNDDNWDLAIVSGNETLEGPYGVGVSIENYQGTNNSPTLQCPASECHAYFTNGSVYRGDFNAYTFFFTIRNPQLQTLPNGRTFYDNGPDTVVNTLYIWFTHSASWAVKRTFEVTMERFDISGALYLDVRTVVGDPKFYVDSPQILEQQPYPPSTGWDTPYYAPGNEMLTITYDSSTGEGTLNRIQITNFS
jgi:hypothetical protein